MVSYINVVEKNGQLQLTLKRKNEYGYVNVSNTYNTEIIYDFFEDVKDDIVSAKRNQNTINIILENNIQLIIPASVTKRNIKIFTPINEGLHIFKEAKRKRWMIGIKITTFAVFLFAMVNILDINKEDSSSFVNKIKSIDWFSEPETDEKKEEKTDCSNDKIKEVASTQEVATPASIAEILTPTKKIIADNFDIPSLSNSILQKEVLEKVDFSEYLPGFGACCYDEKYLSVIENYGDITKKYAEISGIDVEIINCVLAQERGMHSTVPDKGGAIGVAQIQVNQHLGSKLTIYNVITGEEETFTVTMDLLQSVDGNIKVCVALLQSAWIKFDGNIFLMLQAYNYGEGAMETVIRRYGNTPEEINENYSDLSFIEEIYNYSIKKGGYGDKEYLNNIFSRYPSDELTICYGDHPLNLNNQLIVNVKTQQDNVLEQNSNDLSWIDQTYNNYTSVYDLASTDFETYQKVKRIS